MELRYYQKDAIDALFTAMKSPDPCLAVLPTGAGKSLVISSIALQVVNRWNGRVAIISHVKELIQQVAETIRKVDPFAPVGIYSAGIGRKNASEKITVAGIQSIYKKAHELGAVQLILVDECHLIPPDGEGMYRKFLDDMRIINPKVRLAGLTATNYRLSSGYINGEDKLFKNLAYEISVRKLIDEGYLSYLRGKDGGAPDLSSVGVRGGEYIPAELNAAMDDSEKIKKAVEEIVHYGVDRIGWLIFCCSVEHANHVCEEIKKHNIDSRVVIGDTPSAERDEIIREYKEKKIRCLVSVGVLTTGFDAPHIDLIALLRPTKSPGLYYQMSGRGLRKADGKKDCLILDMAGCIYEHGPVDDIQIKEKRKKKNGEKTEAPIKTCPQCAEIILAALRTCPACSYEYPEEIAKHEATAYDASPLKEVRPDEEIEINNMDWCVHIKKGADENAPKTLRIDYYSPTQKRALSEWVCIEHEGFARRKAENWWREHCGCELNFNKSVDAFDWLEKNRPRCPVKLLVNLTDKFPSIIAKVFADNDSIDKCDDGLITAQENYEEAPF